MTYSKDFGSYQVVPNCVGGYLVYPKGESNPIAIVRQEARSRWTVKHGINAREYEGQHTTLAKAARFAVIRSRKRAHA